MPYATLFHIDRSSHQQGQQSKEYWSEKSRSVPFQNVLDDPGAPWDWKVLSICTATPSLVMGMPFLDWDYRTMSRNYSITPELVEKFIDLEAHHD